MTALDRARSWFLDPTDPSEGATATAPAPAPTVPSPLGGRAPAGAPPASSSPSPLGGGAPAGAPPAVASSSPLGGGAPAGPSPAVGSSSPAQPKSALGGGGPAGPPSFSLQAVASAAVLGQPGDAEPVAASLALALSRGARPATVAVLGGATAPATAATPAARRLAARLDAQGLSARPRGRLVWVALPEAGALVTARRVALVSTPVVVAVAAPRTAEIDELLAEQDLVLLVTADPDGPLARLARAAPETTPVVVVPPLGRGLARALARGGVRPARSIRAALAGAGVAR